MAAPPPGSDRASLASTGTTQSKTSKKSETIQGTTGAPETAAKPPSPTPSIKADPSPKPAPSPKAASSPKKGKRQPLTAEQLAQLTVDELKEQLNSLTKIEIQLLTEENLKELSALIKKEHIVLMSPEQKKMMLNILEEEIEEKEMVYGARHIIMLFTPVSICMTFVVFTVTFVDFFTQRQNVYPVYVPFTKETEDNSAKLFQAVGNAIIIICAVVIMTFVLLGLYKLQCYKCLTGWIMMSSFAIFFFIFLFYLSMVLSQYNVPMDFITVSLLIWNFGVGGMVFIYWKGPLIMQQAYLIMMSAMVALMYLKILPDWTPWIVLCLLVLWDLFAVLSPYGPLRMLVETASDRNENLFQGIIYSSTMVWDIAHVVNGDYRKKKLLKLLSKFPNNNNNLSNNAAEGEEESDRKQSNTGSEQTAPLVMVLGGVGSSNAVDETAARPTGSAPVDAEGFGSGAKGKTLRKASSAIDPVKRQEPVQEKLAAVPEENQTSVSADEQQKAEQQKAERQKAELTAEKQRAEAEEEFEERGVKLGLGDFVFYSMLVGKASTGGDWNTTIACFVAILIGLFFTIVLLAIYRKALPALPISLTFGLVFYFCTSLVVVPFVNSLNANQVYI